MASIYFEAPDEIVDLVQRVMRKNHQDLVKAKVDVGVLFALSAQESQPALKEHGQQVEGIIKIIAPRDRVKKKIDVEMILDGDEWKTNRDEHKIGLIDHLLARLEIKKPKPKKKKRQNVHGSDSEREEAEAQQEFMLDAGGRAVLKMRKSDIYVGVGFRDVIERNGAFAPEYRAIEKARALAEAACETLPDESHAEGNHCVPDDARTAGTVDEPAHPGNEPSQDVPQVAGEAGDDQGGDVPAPLAAS